MDIPGLGPVTKDDDLGWYYSRSIPIPMLGGKPCRIVVEGYDDDPRPQDYHAAIANFLKAGPDVLQAAESHLYRYYQEMTALTEVDARVEIQSPAQIWAHVRLGNEPMVCRRKHGDKGIYVSLENGCDWEEEHGLQIVIKNGLQVTKVGPYDGHLTNSDAYDDARLENVVFRSFSGR